MACSARSRAPVRRCRRTRRELFALSYIEGEVKDGVLVANGDFQDPADQLAGG